MMKKYVLLIMLVVFLSSGCGGGGGTNLGTTEESQEEYSLLKILNSTEVLSFSGTGSATGPAGTFYINLSGVTGNLTGGHISRDVGFIVWHDFSEVWNIYTSDGRYVQTMVLEMPNTDQRIDMTHIGVNEWRLNRSGGNHVLTLRLLSDTKAEGRQEGSIKAYGGTYRYTADLFFTSKEQ